MHQIWGLQNKENTNRRWMVCICTSYWYCIRWSPVTSKGIVRNHLPQQYKFSRKEITINDSYDGSDLFTTISGA